jgi:hypothetical protein
MPGQRHFVERHFDYQLRVDSLAAGVRRVFPLPIQTDAPFLARSVALVQNQDATDFDNLQIQFTDNKQAFRIGGLANVFDGTVGGYITGPDSGRGGNFTPIYPQIPFPRDGEFLITLSNPTVAAMVNIRIIFRGVKLFEPGVVWSPTYPVGGHREIPNDFTLGFTVTDSQTLNNRVVAPNFGTDFVYRCGQILENFDSNAYGNMEAILRDHQGRAYSNDWIHVNYLFGRLMAERPGIIYPEIYIPNQQALFFDIRRTDSVIAPGDVTMNLAFKGAQVLPL